MAASERLAQFEGRKVVLCSEKRIYVCAEPLLEINPKKIDGAIALMNVFRGIQWYKAYCMEGYASESDEKRANQLLEIFDQTNLVTLSKIVEMQTGTSGLIESLLNSYKWADWRIGLGQHDVGEMVLAKPNVSFSVGVGERGCGFKLAAIRLYDQDPKTQIFEEVLPLHNSEEWDDDEFTSLPEFCIKNVEIFENRAIRFEGLPLDEMENHDSLKKEYFSYILTRDGDLEFDTKTRYDKEYVFNKMMADVKGPTKIFSYFGQKGFNREKITNILSKDPFGRRVLARFLLPYCDEPSATGIHYVLPEEIE